MIIPAHEWATSITRTDRHNRHDKRELHYYNFDAKHFHCKSLLTRKHNKRPYWWTHENCLVFSIPTPMHGWMFLPETQSNLTFFSDFGKSVAFTYKKVFLFLISRNSYFRWSYSGLGDNLCIIYVNKISCFHAIDVQKRVCSCFVK